jgi:8-oxo-dGTP diphosphatase
MIRYVLGFAFDLTDRVALIQKQRPDWQKGLWNGIGGKVEPYDSSNHDAMEREFREETGVTIGAHLWRPVARMVCEGVWECLVFTVRHEDVGRVKSMTDEYVRLCTCNWFERHKHEAIENVPSLIELCLMKPGHSGKAPFTTLTYENAA